MMLTAEFYCITEHYAGRMCNFVCLMLQLSLLFLLCVVMFAADCILIGSCACGCSIKLEFSKLSCTHSLWGAAVMAEVKTAKCKCIKQIFVSCLLYFYFRCICDECHLEFCKPVSLV